AVGVAEGGEGDLEGGEVGVAEVRVVRRAGLFEQGIDLIVARGEGDRQVHGRLGGGVRAVQAVGGNDVRDGLAGGDVFQEDPDVLRGGGVGEERLRVGVGQGRVVLDGGGGVGGEIDAVAGEGARVGDRARVRLGIGAGRAGGGHGGGG